MYVAHTAAYINGFIHNNQIFCPSTVSPTFDDLADEIYRCSFLWNLRTGRKGHVGEDCTQPIQIEVKEENIFVLVFFNIGNVVERKFFRGRLSLVHGISRNEIVTVEGKWLVRVRARVMGPVELAVTS